MEQKKRFAYRESESGDLKLLYDHWHGCWWCYRSEALYAANPVEWTKEPCLTLLGEADKVTIKRGEDATKEWQRLLAMHDQGDEMQSYEASELKQEEESDRYNVMKWRIYAHAIETELNRVRWKAVHHEAAYIREVAKGSE